MGTITKIAWTDHSFNPWRGCTRTASGCQNCYAERQSRINPAVLGEWGSGGARPIAAESYWRLPLLWNRAAAAIGRRRVFVGSMMDVFEDREDLEQPRRRLFNLIYDCRALDWLLLTKRPQVMFGSIGGQSGAGWNAWPDLYPHAWLGYSASTQADLDYGLPHLMKCPAAVRFLSLEPLLEPIDLRATTLLSGASCNPLTVEEGHYPRSGFVGPIHWVIIGGESGPDARPCQVDWIRDLVARCQAAAVPCFVKQLGARSMLDGILAPLQHAKGGDPAEWPENLRVQEFPQGARA